MSFKLKQDILFLGSRHKDTGFSLSEHVSPKIRSERKSLLEFAKAKNVKFRLRYNRLYIGDQTYYVDAIIQSVKSNAT